MLRAYMRRRAEQLTYLAKRYELSEEGLRKLLELHEEVWARGLHRRVRVGPLQVAMVYLVSRLVGNPIPLKGDARFRARVYRAFRLLVRELGLEVPPLDPTGFLPRLAARFGLPPHVQEKALLILRRFREAGFSQGKTPRALAAAAVHLACAFNRIRHTQRAIAAFAGVSDVSLRSIARQLTERCYFCAREGKPGAAYPTALCRRCALAYCEGHDDAHKTTHTPQGFQTHQNEVPTRSLGRPPILITS